MDLAGGRLRISRKLALVRPRLGARDRLGLHAGGRRRLLRAPALARREVVETGDDRPRARRRDPVALVEHRSGRGPLCALRRAELRGCERDGAPAPMPGPPYPRSARARARSIAAAAARSRRPSLQTVVEAHRGAGAHARAGAWIEAGPFVARRLGSRAPGPSFCTSARRDPRRRGRRVLRGLLQLGRLSIPGLRPRARPLSLRGRRQVRPRAWVHAALRLRERRGRRAGAPRPGRVAPRTRSP